MKMFTPNAKLHFCIGLIKREVLEVGRHLAFSEYRENKTKNNETTQPDNVDWKSTDLMKAKSLNSPVQSTGISKCSSV